MKKLIFAIALLQLHLFALPNQNNGITMRYQEPIAPFPYLQEEVVFRNVSADVTLAGTLTLPNGTGPFPVAVLLHGSAPLDRDAAMLGHKPFLVWADHLTKQGIAVLRYDKRSAGKSTGDYSTSNLEDFADDALAAIEYLKTRKEIDKQQIGLIGHSEGGMTAVLANSKTQDVAFIVLLASPCVNWEELVLEQEKAFQQVDGVSEEMMSRTRLLRQQIFSILKREPNREIAENEILKLLAQLAPSEKKVVESYYGPIEGQAPFFNSVWFRFNLVYDPANALKQVKVPLLALNGELDLLVSPAQNLTRIAQVLEEAGHTDYTVVTLPKMNHGFQTCEIGTMAEGATIEETTAPIVLNIMSKWILERTSRS